MERRRISGLIMIFIAIAMTVTIILPRFGLLSAIGAHGYECGGSIGSTGADCSPLFRDYYQQDDGGMFHLATGEDIPVDVTQYVSGKTVTCYGTYTNIMHGGTGRISPGPCYCQGTATVRDETNNMGQQIKVLYCDVRSIARCPVTCDIFEQWMSNSANLRMTWDFSGGPIPPPDIPVIDTIMTYAGIMIVGALSVLGGVLIFI